MSNWSLEIGGKARGMQRFVGMWEIEKLCKVVEGLIETYNEDGPDDGQWEVFRNITKLACWMAGNPSRYSEEGTEAAFNAGGEAMKTWITEILMPVLDMGRYERVGDQDQGGE